jgi:hypothetical protein
LRRVAVGGGYEQFVGPEVILGRAPERYSQHGENRFVERAARPNVAYDELDVIDQAAAVQFLSWHSRSFRGSTA